MGLHIRDVSKTYSDGVQALKDVTLTTPAGMYGLPGPNGAGKSTLMRMIATLQEPDAGTITLGDIDVVRQKDEVRQTLGYLPQEFGVYPNVSAEALLDHFAILKGMAQRRARKEVVEALLRQTNLSEVRKQKLGGYSGGMRQRFGVAVALLGNPKLLIVDEPTAGLDPAEPVRFLNLLSELGENSVVLLSTHIVEDVANYSALRVVEETYGHEHMRRVLGMWRAFHEIPRTRAAAPLLRATEPFQYRRKASLAMHALSEYIGAERVDDALRRLFEKHRSGALPLPTTLDLYRELQAVTPDSLQSLLHDLFAANTFWELETERAAAEQTAAGTWQVTLDVQARKVVVDAAGVETEVPMDDWVEVGVFGESEAYLQKHRIRSGKQSITVTVARKPTRAGVDPSDLLIDLATGDNIKNVKTQS